MVRIAYYYLQKNFDPKNQENQNKTQFSPSDEVVCLINRKLSLIETEYCIRIVLS